MEVLLATTAFSSPSARRRCEFVDHLLLPRLILFLDAGPPVGQRFVHFPDVPPEQEEIVGGAEALMVEQGIYPAGQPPIEAVLKLPYLAHYRTDPLGNRHHLGLIPKQIETRG